MDEDKIQQNRREADEQATSQRAAILGIKYLDTRQFENTIPLIDNLLEIPVMHQSRIVPMMAGNETEPWQFGVTTQTPQSFIRDMTSQ